MSALSQKAKAETEVIKKDLEKRTEEVAILKAKLFLDQIQITLKVVAEYPDMVEENNELMRGISEQEKTLEL
jgi:hypothetical protein